MKRSTEAGILAKKAELELLGGIFDAACGVVAKVLDDGEQPPRFPLSRAPGLWSRVSFCGDFHWLSRGAKYAYVARNFLTSDPFDPALELANVEDCNKEGYTEIFRLPLDPDLTVTIDAILAQTRPGEEDPFQHEQWIEIQREARAMLKKGVKPEEVLDWEMKQFQKPMAS
jgi:hypothetical protein